VRLAVAVFTFLFTCIAHAANFGDGRIGAGSDVIHDKGMPMAIVTLTPASVLVWSHNAGLALAYPFGRRAGLNGSAGGILVSNVNEDVGTYLNFYGTVSYCGRKLCLSFAHISHGKGILKIREDAPNHGINFLFLEYRLR
jgi:hypothetical protein